MVCYTSSPDMFSRPIELQFLRQSPLMTTGVGEPGEPQELGARGLQRKAELPTFVQVALHSGLHCRAGAHAALPGHGIATADNRATSTLA